MSTQVWKDFLFQCLILYSFEIRSLLIGMSFGVVSVGGIKHRLKKITEAVSNSLASCVHVWNNDERGYHPFSLPMCHGGCIQVPCVLVSMCVGIDGRSREAWWSLKWWGCSSTAPNAAWAAGDRSGEQGRRKADWERAGENKGSTQAPFYFVSQTHWEKTSPPLAEWFHIFTH